MSNRSKKKLYRSIAGTALALFAGLVLAPTIVTAGYQASSKKPAEAPAVELAQEAPAAPATHRVPELYREALPAPTNHGADDAAPAESQPGASGPQEQDIDDTAFAVNDFAPPAAALHSVSSRGGVAGGSRTVATSGSPSLGGGKITFQPHPAKPETGANGGGQGADAGDPDKHDGEPGDDTATGPTNPPAEEHEEVAANDPPADPHNPAPTDEQPDTTNPPVNDDIPPPSHGGYPVDTRPVAEVPEPSSLALLAAGILGLVLVRRRS